MYVVFVICDVKNSSRKMGASNHHLCTDSWWQKTTPIGAIMSGRKLERKIDVTDPTVLG